MMIRSFAMRRLSLWMNFSTNWNQEVVSDFPKPARETETERKPTESEESVEIKPNSSHSDFLEMGEDILPGSVQDQ